MSFFEKTTKILKPLKTFIKQDKIKLYETN